MQLDSTLRALGASAMVVGHTPQMGGLNAECDGRVWRVDAGMSSGVLNAAPQVLEFRRDGQGRLVACALQEDTGAAPSCSYVYDEGKRRSRRASDGAVAA